MAPSHAAYTDDPFGEMVTGGKKAFASHMPWHNRNASQRQKRTLDKFPSGIFQIIIHGVEYMYILSGINLKIRW